MTYLRCRIAFRTALPVRNAYVEQWIKEHPLRRRISIRQSDRIATPLTYGIFHPVILMPKQTDWKNSGQLQYIFAHEYVHICRFDALTKRMVLYALCIHWFNPFVWVMFFLFNRDMELACYESVIRQFGDRARSAYSLVFQTEKYHGGWSLYDGEIMKDFPKVGNGEANRAACALLCLKQVVFEDGAVWNNPDYENWFKEYAGKEVGIDELQNYYPYEYRMGSE